MTVFLSLLFSAFALSSSGQASAAPAPPVQLTVQIQDVRSSNGVIYLSVFDDPQAFPQDSNRAVKIEHVQAQAGEVTITIDGLTPGTYALSTFHDENNNGKLDSGAFGIPKEGFGFSNNPVIHFGPPSFEQAKILLQMPMETAVIKLNHL